MNPPEQYQVITLILEDGRRVSYSGRFQIPCSPPPSVVGIEFNWPRLLPAGCSWDREEKL